ncbi:type II/IV secretion system protein [Rhodocyclus tenuis]|uniref:GspE/PulE family protein n=1 Tax=Rhodocyclus gracilis TaxID=2929842 RepID=UPI001355A5D3|nr:type II/IV secretion system protein [Rhodocyclus gracilis]
MNAPDLALPAVPFSAAEIARARAQTGSPLLDALETQSALAPADFCRRLAATVRLPWLSLPEMQAHTAAFAFIPFNEALQRGCVPLRTADDRLLLAIADPFDFAVGDWAQHRAGQVLTLHLAARGDVTAYLAAYEESLRAMDDIVSDAGSAEDDAEGEEISLKSIGEDASPIVRLVNSTLYDALKAGASDIHLETAPAGIFIKYRIDGVLVSVGGVQGRDTAEQVISRIKVLAELDIAERRVPQDGRFRVLGGGRRIDVRVSIMPSIHGEDAVLRILDRQRITDSVTGLRLETLGYQGSTLDCLRRLSNEPYGMLLVTGPTGSGKTTTLYAALGEINHGHDKIVTIEDPVEYQLPGILQIPVNEKKGLTFARGLRSILRHDPDKIMVGEIRDGETATIAVQAALTGHLVFTTVHANNAFDVLGRFTHMGVDPYSLVAALNGVVAQRLLRVNCPACAEDETPSPQLLAQTGLADAEARAGFRFRRGRGCAQCRGTGFKGRRAIAEVLVLDDRLREMIAAREPVRQIKEAAQRSGTRLLREAGLDLVRAGDTSLAELDRVVA